MPKNYIFDFNINSDIKNWETVDDAVMGGNSIGNFELNTAGFGVFKGNISLENNGGFSSVRYRFKKLAISNFTEIVLKLKGDGKKYQFRIKNTIEANYAYITPFLTSGEWQTIKIPLKDMVPWFRGKKLDQPNFAHTHIEEIAFLIANKKAEGFELLIDSIELR